MTKKKKTLFGIFIESIGLYFSNRDFNANKELENDYFSIYTKHPLGLFEEPDENKINGIFDILTNLKNN